LKFVTDILTKFVVDTFKICSQDLIIQIIIL